MKLKTPLSEEAVRKLRAGDNVELSGVVVTARDTAHKYLTKGSKKKLPFNLEGGVLYHCGPIVKGREIVAAGPTTSMREEPYEADVIRRYGVRGVIGKGGMGSRTLEALQEYGAVYFSAVGGAAALMAEAVKKTVDVYMLEEFGMPEAFWVLEVEDLPLTVSMDSHGDSIYNTVEERSRIKLREILNTVK